MANRMMSFLSRRFFRRVHQFSMRRQLKPLHTQEKLWRKMRSRLQGTKVYEDLGLSDIKTYQDYVKKIAPRSYEFYSSYVERIEQGETNVLFNDQLDCMALTSGTTGFNNKKIPINKSMLKIFGQFQFQTGGYFYHQFPQLQVLSDKRFVYSSPPISELRNGIKYGYLTGIMASKKLPIVEKNIFPTKEILAITQWDEQLDKIIETCLKEDIRIIQGIPCYIYNVFKGILEKTGKKHIKEIWPNIHTMVYVATPIEHLRRSLDNVIGKRINYLGLYSSTEAPLGIQAKEEENKVYYAPFLDSVLMSFSPINDPSQCLGVDEVQVGKSYYLNTGTPNGLLQYAVNDCIKVVQTNPCLLIEVEGRKGGAINIAAEKVSQASLIKTFGMLREKFNLDIEHFFVYPIHPVNGRPFYEWALCAPHTLPMTEDELAQFLDHALMEVAEDYKERRIIDGVIAPCKVIQLPSQFFEAYFQRNRHRGQFKMGMIFEGKDHFTTLLQNTTLGQLQQMLG